MYLTSQELGQLIVNNTAIHTKATERGYVTVQEIEYLLQQDEELYQSVIKRSRT